MEYLLHGHIIRNTGEICSVMTSTFCETYIFLPFVDGSLC